MYHIPNSQLEIQIIAEYTWTVWVQLQITKCCIINISAQLLLSKHRHSKKPTGTKSQQVISKGYLQSKDIDRILIIYSFQDLLAGMKFKMIKIFCVGQQRKGRKTTKFVHLFEKKGAKFARIHQNPTKHWPTGTKQSYLSEFCTFRLTSASIQKKKNLDFQAFRIIFTILTALCHKLNH